MAGIIKYIITILICAFIIKLGYLTLKRFTAAKKLQSLKKESGAKINFLRSPLASYFTLSGMPDVTVEIGNTVYLIRFINGRSGYRFLHFASPEYFVTYSKMRISLGGLVQRGARYKVVKAQGTVNTSRQRVKKLPELKIPGKYKRKIEFNRIKAVPVLIINPAPNEVTYVSESRTAIKAAFTGDDVYGQKIFTVSSFVTYADRMKRQEDKDRREGIFI